MEERPTPPRAPRLRPFEPPVNLDTIPELLLPASRLDVLKVEAEAPRAPKMRPIPDPPHLDIDMDFELPPPMLELSDESEIEEPNSPQELVDSGRGLLALLEDAGNTTEDTMVFSFHCPAEEDHDRHSTGISTMVLHSLPEFCTDDLPQKKEIKFNDPKDMIFTCIDDDLSSSPILSALRWRATSDCSTCASTPPRDERTSSMISFNLGKRMDLSCDV